jgi:D-lyxose ketol-isomerase
MITRAEQRQAQSKALKLFEDAGVVLNDREKEQIEVVDFGLGDLTREGAQILTIVQTARISVKLIALTPHQTEPEHWHPPIGDDPGKEETVRHLYGELLFFVQGEDNLCRGAIPEGKESYYTCGNEILMFPGDQITCEPGAKHWFQAGEHGAVLYSFSTVARDALDEFSDPGVERITKIADE